MAENSGIEWTHHTFNPWTGCTKVSPACDFCYAEAWSKRSGHVEWGPHAQRRRTKTWGDPVKWNRRAEVEGTRYRVFCASLADVFDNHKSILPEWRDELWRLIAATPHLDWLLLTKRPQNIARYLPENWREGWSNVWLGTTVENQTEWNRRWPALAAVPCKVRFVSAEPLLGPIEMEGEGRLHWLIMGGESGPNHRHTDHDWFRMLRDQCEMLGVDLLFKQFAGKNQTQIKALGRELDGVVHDGYPVPA